MANSARFACTEFSEVPTIPIDSQLFLRITRHSVPFRGSAIVPNIILRSPSPEKGRELYIRAPSSNGLFLAHPARVRTPRQPYSPKYVEGVSCELRLQGVLGRSPGRVTRGETHTKRAGTSMPRPSALLSNGCALGVLLRPYLAVDLLDEGLAVLVVLLVFAHLLQILGRTTLKPLGDLIDGQLIVVRVFEGDKDGGA